MTPVPQPPSPAQPIGVRWAEKGRRPTLGVRDLRSLTWTEIPHRPTVVVPVGSLEQHGPLLPLDTDVRIAEAVARGLAEALDRERGTQAEGPPVVLAPPIVYTASGEHEGFPGTVSVGTDVASGLVVELVRSLVRWAGDVVLVNAHGGNIPAIPDAVRLLEHEGHPVQLVGCEVPGSDLHAGRTETSLMLHIDASAVRTGMRVAGYVEEGALLMPKLRAHGVRAVSPSGVLGDPVGANAAEGAVLLAGMVARARAHMTAKMIQDGPRCPETTPGSGEPVDPG